MQLFYLLHNRRTLISFFAVIVFSFYSALKISNIVANTNSILIATLFAYTLFNFFLYITIFDRDNILGRFEHYIANGYKFFEILFLRSFIISISSIVFACFILFIQTKIYNLRDIMIVLPNFNVFLIVLLPFFHS